MYPNFLFLIILVSQLSVSYYPDCTTVYSLATTGRRGGKANKHKIQFAPLESAPKIAIYAYI